MSISRPPNPLRTPGEAGVRFDAVDARMVGMMRCVLASSALVIIWIDPSEPQRWVELTYTSLVLYCAYSALLAYLAYRSDWPTPARPTHWIDVLFYACLVALTEGTGSIFFHFFLFSILVASFSRGFREGISVTAASLVLFLTVGLIAAPGGHDFELNRTLIRGVYLAALGYMIAFWGGHETLLKRRLRLLREINNLGNPRFGPEHAIEANLSRLLAFYDGDACVLVLKHSGPPARYRLYRVTSGNRQPSATMQEITEGAAGPLLRLPEALAAVYRSPEVSRWRKFGNYYAWDYDLRARTNAHQDQCAALSNLLETRVFITAPYAQQDETTGRIYLTLKRSAVSPSDVHFLAQASGAISTVVESMRLVEELIARASEHERLKISRDLHDTTIQPYIGLKLALDALQRDAGADSEVSKRIADLVEMTNVTIQDLRNYASSLKDNPSMPAEFLISAVQRQAERLRKYYGIDVEVNADISSELSAGTAAQAFQIISEALSNILRHTSAKAAFVSIVRDGTDLSVIIGNEANAGNPVVAEFNPRSIRERARSLGGTAVVEQRADGYTLVNVNLPMRVA
ncbi:MAG TPA: histidine kinase [Burkholderiales bacterium]|nr:histidine kinase [Burkholderiales bacterium]